MSLGLIGGVLFAVEMIAVTSVLVGLAIGDLSQGRRRAPSSGRRRGRLQPQGQQ